MLEKFEVKHYTDSPHPCIKGNGFDGLTIGDYRDQAEEFVLFMNKLIEEKLDSSSYYFSSEYELEKTCDACPEQYNVFKKEVRKKVGYLRLRHGYFSASVPDCGGTVVYGAFVAGDGCFEPHERNHFLNEAITAIDNYLDKQKDKE